VVVLLLLVTAALADIDSAVVKSEPRRIDPPPFSYRCTVPDTRPVTGIRLALLSTQPNDITDQDQWFENNGLVLPAWQVPNPFRGIQGNLPGWVPERFKDCIIVRASLCPDAAFLTYGRDFSEGRYLFAVDTARGAIRYAYDLVSYTLAPKWTAGDSEFVTQALAWVEERDGILYLANSHRTYAASSKGMNGYVTALDPLTGAILWRSRSRVCNSRNFEIVGDCIICGYGFTAEPDYIYVLNRFTGAVLSRTSLKTAPDYFVRRNDSLYVRCYDTDYVFRITEDLR
jgi:hypothetical protein